MMVQERERRKRLLLCSLSTLALVAMVVLNRERGAVYLHDAEKSTVAVAGDSPKSIKQISLLGERNSGTRWMTGHLQECFNHSLIVKKEFTRYKHWFQYPNSTKYAHDTLVIAQFRNPYDWLEAMRNVPHHAPNHMFIGWYDFLTTPWTMERQGLDLGLANDTMCHQDFSYNQIVSCVPEPIPKEKIEADHELRFSEETPIYELKQDGSGEPFASIMELRTAKIYNTFEIKNYEGVADVWISQYEYQLAKGTKYLLDLIANWTGVAHKCVPYPPQERRKRELSARFAQFVNQRLDWKAEELIGYKMHKL